MKNINLAHTLSPSLELNNTTARLVKCNISIGCRTCRKKLRTRKKRSFLHTDYSILEKVDRRAVEDAGQREDVDDDLGNDDGDHRKENAGGLAEDPVTLAEFRREGVSHDEQTPVGGEHRRQVDDGQVEICVTRRQLTHRNVVVKKNKFANNL